MSKYPRLGWFGLALMSLGCAESDVDTLRERALSASTIAPLSVGECNEYLSRVETCIASSSSIPDHQKSQAISGLRKKRDQWAALADSEIKRAALARVCVHALEAASTEYAGWSCSFSTTTPGTGGASSSGGAAGTGGASSSGGAAGTGGASSSGGAAGTGGASCTVASATDLGAPGQVSTAPANGCVKVQQGYPSWWGTRVMQLQTQSPGTYPVPFSWSNACTSSSGSGTFSADWQSRTTSPVSAACPVLIELNGTHGTIRITYHAQ